MTRLIILFLLTITPLSTVARQNPGNLPPNYQTVLTNGFFKVIRVHYGPHEKVPVHNHPANPTVYVYLNDSGPVNIMHDQPQPFTVTRPPTHLGAFRFSPGQIERHSIENLSDLPSDFLRVELPQLHLSDKTTEFRGPAPTTLAQNIDAAEFSSPHVTVIRILCVTPTPCTIPPTSVPSVLVAFSDTSLIRNGQSTKIRLGSIVPIDQKQTIQITPVTPTAPAHILLISTQ